MIMLEKFKKFVDEMNEQNSRTYKCEVLNKYKADEDIKYLLNFIYNPYITTGIGAKSYQRFHNDCCIDSYPKNIFNSTKEALEYLKVHNTADYNTRELMFSYYMCIHLADIKNLLLTNTNSSLHNLPELFYNIITKNLQLGIDTKTINKIIPKLIPEFSVQLANKYFDKPEFVEGKEFALTNKIDGSRIIALKENGRVSFYSRQGQKYEGLIDLENEMSKMLPDNICLDGELTLLNPGNLASKDQYKQTMKISRKDGEKHDLKMLVFDCMTAEEFRNQACNIPYITRRNNLLEAFSQNLSDFKICTEVAIGCEPCDYFNSIIKELNKRYTYFQILPYLYIGNDTNKIMTYLDIQTSKNEEGVIINLLAAPYHFNRTNDLLKVKKFNDCDLKIIGFEEGTNKLNGTLGALILDYKGNKLRCGSGFSDEQRAEIWANRDQYLGKIAEIKYFEETTNQNGGISLRFPIFKDIRTDKIEPNY